MTQVLLFLVDVYKLLTKAMDRVFFTTVGVVILLAGMKNRDELCALMEARLK